MSSKSCHLQSLVEGGSPINLIQRLLLILYAYRDIEHQNQENKSVLCIPQ